MSMLHRTRQFIGHVRDHKLHWYVAAVTTTSLVLQLACRHALHNLFWG